MKNGRTTARILAVNAMAALLIARFGFEVVACTPGQAKDATDAALTAAELACIMQSAVLDVAELERICRVAKPLLPVVRDLVSVREGARRAGVVWRTAADGGVSDAGDTREP